MYKLHNKICKKKWSPETPPIERIPVAQNEEQTAENLYSRIGYCADQAQLRLTPFLGRR